MQRDDYLAHLTRDGTRMADLARGNLDAPVPTCPEWSLRDYEREEISSLRNHPDLTQVKVLRTKSIRLDRLRARRFAVQFVEKNQNVVIDHIIALHQGVEYELILRTIASRLVKDEKQLAKVLASWRLTRRL